MSNVLVTGANGFIGQAVCAGMCAAGWRVKAAVRNLENVKFPPSIEPVKIDTIGRDAKWTNILENTSKIIHLAARVHVMKERATDPLSEFRDTNVLGTMELARAAVLAGVRRFVYVSSIKVNGEVTCKNAFTETDYPAPSDAYSISKWEAEQGLRSLSENTGLEVVIVRPPLVYGPGVKGNFYRLIKLVDKGVPLPLGNISNSRSLVGLGNIVDFLVLCALDPRAVGKTFLVSDGRDLSTSVLIGKIASALNKRAMLFSLPPTLLKTMGKLVGLGGTIDRLCNSLEIDASRARKELNWHPPNTIESELDNTVKWYRQSVR